MAIEITVIKSPDHVQLAKVCQIFTEQGGSIGRGEDNTWVVEDPERYISSTHTQIEYENGQYYLSDVSTNGTFINGSAEPVGNGNRVPLKDGDNFSMGDYEFRVSVNQSSAISPAANADPFAQADFSAQSAHGLANSDGYAFGMADYSDPFTNAGYGAAPFPEMAPVSGPEETDPIALLDRAGVQPQQFQQPNPFLEEAVLPSQGDNADPLQHAVAWPNVIPDDWDKDDSDEITNNPQAAPGLPPAQEEDVSRSIQDELHTSENRRKALEAENEKLLAELIQLKQKLKNLKSSSARHNKTGASARADETMLETMGLGQWNISESKKQEISGTVGHLMRETINGLMKTLGFRKKIKEEFRINVTTIQPVENNPLKFSANLDDAIENMFIKENKAYMNPVDAVVESFQAISEHQIALLAGMQAAFRGMIERLDPDALEKRFEKYRKTGVIKVGQKGKNWESYKEFHQDLVNNMDNSFQYLFGYDFVQAYEEQLQRLLVARKSKSRRS